MYEELVRGLRRCSYTTVAGYDREDGYCKPCAYFNSNEDITCMDMMMIDAADAIEELSAENKKLYETIKRAYLIINSLIPNMEETEHD